MNCGLIFTLSLMKYNMEVFNPEKLKSSPSICGTGNLKKPRPGNKKRHAEIYRGLLTERVF